jgi:hypothetical protein
MLKDMHDASLMCSNNCHSNFLVARVKKNYESRYSGSRTAKEYAVYSPLLSISKKKLWNAFEMGL